MEHGSFIVGLPIKTSIYKGFSMAMLNNQMVLVEIMLTTVYMSMRVVNEVVRLWRIECKILWYGCNKVGAADSISVPKETMLVVNAT